MSTRAPTDPRILRTRRRLTTALIELIDEEGYDAITVEKLTRRADVARSTFYLHFSGKEDLLFDGFEDWLRSFGAWAGRMPPRAGLRRFQFSLPFLRHAAARNRFFGNVVLRDASHRVRRRLEEILARVARHEIEEAPGAASDGVEGRGRAVAGALVALLEWWFDEGTSRRADEVDRIFQATVTGAWEGGSA